MPNESSAAKQPRVIYTLQRAFVAVEARKVALLAQQNMLPAHYALMMNIKSHPGVTGAELARLLGVTPQNVAGLVARLLKKGWLDRTSHQRHPHVLELHLTTEGSARLDCADALIGDLNTDLMTVLGSDTSVRLNADLLSLREAIIGLT